MGYVTSRALRAAMTAAVAVGVGVLPAPRVLAPLVVTPHLHADEVDDHAAELRELLKAGDDARLTAKVNSLEKRPEKRIDDALLVVARSTAMPGAAKAAMRVLGLHGDPGYVGWVRSRLVDKRMAEEQRELYVAMLDSLKPAGDSLKPCLPTLSSCVDEYLKTRSDITTRAIAAYGSVQDKSVIPALIGMLEKADTHLNSGGGGGGRGSLTSPPPTMNSGGGGSDPRANVEAAKSAAIDALKALTGGDATNLKAWKIWWWKNEKTFRFPPKEPNWPTLSAFFDELSGLTLKKPAGTQPWTFEKCPYFGGRARLRWTEGASMLACADVIAYPKGASGDAAEFAKGLQESWRTTDFSEFAEGYQPAVVTRKIAGREFAVLTASGVGAATWTDWATCERRVYVTANGADSFLAIEGAVRAGADEPARTAFWTALESVTFKPVK